MIICFSLSMPNVGSWNGKWSGEGTVYAIVKNFGRSKKGYQKALDILSMHSFYYGWSDGWGASIIVQEVNAREAASIRKRSKGFCGYDWMVSSILQYKTILADHEIKDYLEKQAH